jgi:multiple sugar transport system substrate-binding protein
LLPAFQAQPDQFVAFPAPVGPAGRGHLLVLAGLAIPNDARMPEQAAALIEYLTRPSTQMATLQQLGFFPVLSVDSLQSALTPGVASINAALIQQERAPEGITQFVPVGMADRAGDFDLVYLLSFSQIVLRNQDIARTLAHQADTLARLIRETDAACWWEEARALGAKCARETH